MKSLFSILGIILIASLVAISLPRQFHAKTSNLIVNADIERVNWLHQPNNWSHNSWGHNTSRFSVDVGNNSEHGLKISISDYQNGDAKWYFNPITYITDGQYEYKEGYQSTTTSWLVAEFTLTGSNKKVYQELDELPPSASWQNVHVVFMAPTTGGQVTIYHLVKSNGTLASDNFSLERVGYINLLNFVP